MAYNNVRQLQTAQAALEVTRGTAVSTATRYLTPVLGGGILTYAADREDVSEATGTYHGKIASVDGIAPFGPYRVTIAWEELMSFEDLAWWLMLALDGVPAAAGAGPYTRTYTPEASTDNLKTATIKAGYPGNYFQVTRVAVNRLTARFNPESEPTWRVALELVGREFSVGASLTALTRHDREHVPSRGTLVYLDAHDGTIGTTLLTGYVRSGEITIDNQLENKLFAEDTAAVGADFGRGEQLVTGSVVLEWKDDTQFANARAGQAVALRIQASGTDSRRVRFDVPLASWDMPTFGYAGENKIGTFGFLGMKNAANPVPIIAEVVDQQATIP